MKKDLIFKGRKVTLSVAEVTMPSGLVVERELVEHPGAVAVLPMFDDGTIVLEDHYRYAVEGNLLEVPAGTLDEGENPSLCARRELAEETGISAEEMTPLGTFYMSPGVLSEEMHAFLARGLTRGEARLEDDESLEIVEMPFEKALELAESGRIRDAKTISTLFLAERFLAAENRQDID